MIISKIILNDFASHKHTELVLDEIVSLIGSSESGKTNILRALKLVLMAESFPVEYIRDGQTKALVTIVFTSGKEISRERTTTGQAYYFKNEKGETSKYVGVKGVEKRIEDFCGFRKVVFDATSPAEDINFQTVDSMFSLIGRSDTTQRKVTSLVGAGDLERAKWSLAQKARQSKSSLSSKEDELVEIKTRITNARSKVDESESLIYEIAEVKSSLEDNLKKLEKLTDIRNDVNKFGNHLIFNTKSVDEFDTTLVEIKEMYSKLLKTKGDLSDLMVAKKQLSSLEASHAEYHDQFEEMSILLSLYGDIIKPFKCDVCGSVVHG